MARIQPGWRLIARAMISGLALSFVAMMVFRSWHNHHLTQNAEFVSAQSHSKIQAVFDAYFYFYLEDQFKPRTQALIETQPNLAYVAFFSKKGELIYVSKANVNPPVPPIGVHDRSSWLRERGLVVELWVSSGSVTTLYVFDRPWLRILAWTVFAALFFLILWSSVTRPHWGNPFFWPRLWREQWKKSVWRFKRWWGLRPQVLLTILVANAVTGGIIAVSLTRMQTQEYSTKLQKDSLLFSMFTSEKIATDFTNLYYFFYHEKFLPSLKQVISSNENLRRIRIVSAKSRSLLMDSDQLLSNAGPQLQADAPSVDWAQDRMDVLSSSGQWISDLDANGGITIVQAVRNDQLEAWAYVEYTFGNESLVRSLSALKRQILWDLVPSMLFGLLLSVVFAQLLISPIQKLVKAMKQVAAGDYEVSVAMSRGDELGDLLQAFNRMTGELRKKTELRKYLSDATYRQVMAAPDQPGSVLRLHGTRVRATILFSDIRNFVQHCESLEAEEVTTLLTDYFSEMVESVYLHGGEVDKFIGDALLAVFYEPTAMDAKQDGGTTWAAVQASLDMRARLEFFNQRRKDLGKTPIEIGIGLSYGEIISGPIGAKDRMDFTVIGDVVNVANRIEKLSKLGKHTRIVFSGAVEEKVRGLLQYVPLEGASIRGKSEDVTVFELIRVLQLHELTDVLKQSDTEVMQRIRSIQVLGQSKNREALQWILDLFEDPEPRIRDEAVKSVQRLAEINDAEVLDALFLRLKKETSDKVQATLISAIGKLCRSEDILRLAEYLNSDNERVVANAVEALGRFPTEQVTGLLLPKLGSTHNRIKANAAMALFFTGNLQVQLHIINTLKPMLMHSNPLMRSSAAFAIGELTHIAKRSDRPGTGEQSALLTDDWKTLSPDAKQFLAELQETVPMLVALLRDPDISVKRQSVIALGKIKDRSSVLPIINHIDLNLDNKEVLQDIAQALRDIGSHRVVRDVLDKLI